MGYRWCLLLLFHKHASACAAVTPRFFSYISDNFQLREVHPLAAVINQQVRSRPWRADGANAEGIQLVLALGTKGYYMNIENGLQLAAW